MELINININKYFHMIPLWKSPIKLPVELPVEASHRDAGAPQRFPRPVTIAQRRSRPGANNLGKPVFS